MDNAKYDQYIKNTHTKQQQQQQQQQQQTNKQTGNMFLLS
jgi:hypothetical protein